MRRQQCVAGELQAQVRGGLAGGREHRKVGQSEEHSGTLCCIPPEAEHGTEELRGLMGTGFSVRVTERQKMV